MTLKQTALVKTLGLFALFFAAVGLMYVTFSVTNPLIVVYVGVAGLVGWVFYMVYSVVLAELKETVKNNKE